MSYVWHTSLPSGYSGRGNWEAKRAGRLIAILSTVYGHAGKAPEPGGRKYLRFGHGKGGSAAARHPDDLRVGGRLVPEADDHEVGRKQGDGLGARRAVVKQVVVEEAAKPVERDSQGGSGFNLGIGF